MRYLLVLVLSFYCAAALAVIRASPRYERTPTAEDVERLTLAACERPHATKLEKIKLSSAVGAPASQLQDLQGYVTCSPHETRGAITWRHIAFCVWRVEEWACKDERMSAEFSVRETEFQVDFHTAVFSAAQAERVARDIFGLGQVEPLLAGKLPAGACTLQRNHNASWFPGMPSEYTTLDCEAKTFFIKERCARERCRYVLTGSHDRK